MYNKAVLGKIFEKLNFQQKKTIKANLEEGHFNLLGTIAGKKVLLKVIFGRDSENWRNLQREILAGKMISNYNSVHKSDQIHIAEVLASGKSGDALWLIRKYYEGESLSDNATDDKLTLWGYDILKKKYLKRKRVIIPAIVADLKSILKIDKKFIRDRDNLIDVSARFKHDLESCDLNEIERDIGFGLKKQLNFYNENKNNYFSEKNIRVCIGDLVPSNILLTDTNQVILSDFAFFCLDNYLLDITYLWLFLWRYPNWQKEFLANFIKNKNDRDNFRLCLIREIISLGWQKRLAKANHTWLRYLQAAGESFEAIMKIK